MSVESTLSRDQRESIQMARLKALAGSDNKIETLADLAKLPVLRKEKLVELQQSSPPLGPLQQDNFSHLYQSPGPIYEPGFKVDKRCAHPPPSIISRQHMTLLVVR